MINLSLFCASLLYGIILRCTICISLYAILHFVMLGCTMLYDIMSSCVMVDTISWKSSSWFYTMPRFAIVCHAVGSGFRDQSLLHHVVLYHIVPCYVSYYITQHLVIPYRIILSDVVVWHHVLAHAPSSHKILHHVVSCRIQNDVFYFALLGKRRAAVEQKRASIQRASIGRVPPLGETNRMKRFFLRHSAGRQHHGELSRAQLFTLQYAYLLYT